MTISIVIPVYNTETYLPACLDSILSQDFTDFEVLLVDDGSKDGSGAICDAYAGKDRRVRVFHQENGGVSSARNLALEQAGGDWICFIDSDDRLVPGGLQALAGCVSDQVDLVMADFIETTLPRRDVIVKAQIAFDPAISIKEDTLFVVTYLCQSDKPVSVCSAPVYYYIQRPSSAMDSLARVYNPKYLTSFEAIVRINRLVVSTFPDDRKLQYISRDEIMNRVYRIKAHMIRHHALDEAVLSRLRKRAFREAGAGHYLDYQFRRNRRRIIQFVNKVFKTHFHV